MKRNAKRSIQSLFPKAGVISEYLTLTHRDEDIKTTINYYNNSIYILLVYLHCILRYNNIHVQIGMLSV